MDLIKEPQWLQSPLWVDYVYGYISIHSSQLPILTPVRFSYLSI